jgi:hypothetical protein
MWSLFHFEADPDPKFRFDADPNRFTLMQIRIQVFIKVVQICDHSSTYSPRNNYEPPRLHSERPRPSMTLLWTHTPPEFWLRCEYGSGFSFKCGSWSGLLFGCGSVSGFPNDADQDPLHCTVLYCISYIGLKPNCIRINCLMIFQV